MILDAIGKRGQIKRKIYQRVLPENPSKDYYYIMRETPNTTALLIEYGFIDNPNDQKKLQNNLLDYAEGVVQAVANYIGVPYTNPKQEVTMPSSSTYIVKSGDTLYKIARGFNISIDELKRINNLKSENLQIGQILYLKNNDEKTIKQDEYLVRPGDTLYKIANKFDTTINELIEYNNLLTTILSVGQILKIPKPITSSIIYIVQVGDTLYKIANLYQTTIDEIKKINNLTSNLLSVGQELYIPNGPSIEEIDYIVYKVEAGDTLYSIANKYNTTPQDIIEYNNLESNLLTINQILQIPNREIISENSIYTVKNGDTLYKIANKFGVSVKDIMNLNDMDNTILTIGQNILIPKKINDYN